MKLREYVEAAMINNKLSCYAAWNHSKVVKPHPRRSSCFSFLFHSSQTIYRKKLLLPLNRFIVLFVGLQSISKQEYIFSMYVVLIFILCLDSMIFRFRVRLFISREQLASLQEERKLPDFVLHFWPRRTSNVIVSCVVEFNPVFWILILGYVGD